MRAAGVACLALYGAPGGDALFTPGAVHDHKQAKNLNGVDHFGAFVQTFGREYQAGSAEYQQREAIYEAHAQAAARQNAQPGALWRAGESFLWDRTQQEFAALQGDRAAGAEVDAFEGQGSGMPRAGLIQRSKGVLPDEKSWKDLKTFGVTPDQAHCGSCWAIAATRVMQAHSEIHSPVPRTFSAQQLVSCVPNPEKCGGDGGCRGATVELAYRWIMQHGLATATEVPYFGNESKCSANGTQAVASSGAKTPAALASSGAKTPSIIINANSPSAFGMTGWRKSPRNKYEPMLTALAENGPLAVSVSAHNWGLYTDGIFDGCPKDTVISHAVVLIGFGFDHIGNLSKTMFWQVQNSWGTYWGEGGKMRLLRKSSEEEFCGINDDPLKGIGCPGGPPNVTVCGMCGILFNGVQPLF